MPRRSTSSEEQANAPAETGRRRVPTPPQPLSGRVITLPRPSGVSPDPTSIWWFLEPEHDYTPVAFREATVSARVKVLLLRAEEYAKRMGVPVPLQPCPVACEEARASADPDGQRHGVELSLAGLSLDEAKALVHAVRKAGFAAWLRGVGEKGGRGIAPHLHALPLRDQTLSLLERAQVDAYRRGLDGRLDGAPDADADVGRPRPAWDIPT